jgi:hypothetical protein
MAEDGRFGGGSGTGASRAATDGTTLDAEFHIARPRVSALGPKGRQFVTAVSPGGAQQWRGRRQLQGMANPECGGGGKCPARAE